MEKERKVKGEEAPKKKNRMLKKNRKKKNKTDAYNNRVSLNGDSCIIPATKVPSSVTPELPMNERKKKRGTLFRTSHTTHQAPIE